ncbi:MAG TPA: T9SS type A sorting domain-containing protein, partial [Phaeodactylibacter sp.]|nr:T9SS type A sorting domain-containing protein [Phaeodactylibacter sp.]
NAWWEVDLGAVYNIDEVRLWNRTDCCTEHFANFYVLISDVPFSSMDLNTTLNQAGVDSYLVTGEAAYPTTVSTIRTGRYVRVQLAGTAYLAIAEVEIMGCTTVNLNGNNNVNFQSSESSSSDLAKELVAKVFPNPAENLITVDFKTPADGEMQVMLMDARGSRLYQKEFYASVGKHDFTIDISSYPMGSYIVFLRQGDSRKVIRFVKIK